MLNEHGQAGEVSVTPQPSRIFDLPGDSLKVRLLVGTKLGQPGEVVVLSYQRALSEIDNKHAVAV